MRIGHGYDAHKLVKGSHVVLGGIKIDSEFSIEAHSDGDIIIHSLIDSLLGAAAYGDLGTFFPSEDNQYKDCLLYTSPSPRDATLSRMPSSA